MNTFSSFISAFCTSSILIGLLYILVPKKYSAILKFLFGLIFILSVISAFTSIKNITLPQFEISSLGETENTAAVTQARLVYSEALKACGVNFSEIEVCTTKTEDDSIIITKVIIYSMDDKTKILNALGEIAKTREVEIINE